MMTGIPNRRPTEAEAERAKQIAREQGWLTDRGWIWEKWEETHFTSGERVMLAFLGLVLVVALALFVR
jgi:hypothetical protein